MSAWEGQSNTRHSPHVTLTTKTAGRARARREEQRGRGGHSNCAENRNLRRKVLRPALPPALSARTPPRGLGFRRDEGDPDGGEGGGIRVQDTPPLFVVIVVPVQEHGREVVVDDDLLLRRSGGLRLGGGQSLTQQLLGGGVGEGAAQAARCGSPPRGTLGHVQRGVDGGLQRPRRASGNVQVGGGKLVEGDHTREGALPTGALAVRVAQRAVPPPQRGSAVQEQIPHTGNRVHFTGHVGGGVGRVAHPDPLSPDLESSGEGAAAAKGDHREAGVERGGVVGEGGVEQHRGVRQVCSGGPTADSSDHGGEDRDGNALLVEQARLPQDVGQHLRHPQHLDVLPQLRSDRRRRHRVGLVDEAHNRGAVHAADADGVGVDGGHLVAIRLEQTAQHRKLLRS
eukprot:Hpha_TRINITY_DN16367_c1_g6::TRINITY_DN16367_c1_g6_i3::g.62906::m.62906